MSSTYSNVVTSSLQTILKNMSITKKSDFDKLMINFPTDCPLALVNRNNIYTLTDHYFDYVESRIYEEKVVFENSIIDIDNLWLTDSREIHFTNCIFTKNVTIGKREPKLKTIYIDNCIFLDELFIHSINNIQDITIYNSNFKHLNIDKANISHTIFLSTNNILFLTVKDSTAEIFDALKNEIHFFELVDNTFVKSYFSYTQVDLKNIPNIRQLKSYLYNIDILQHYGTEYLGYGHSKLQYYYKRYIANVNLFSFTTNSASDLATASKNYEDEYAIIKTIEFLKTNTTIASDRSTYSTILFYESIFSQKGDVKKFFTWVTGAFVKPYRFMIIYLVILIFFAFIFMSPAMKFSYNMIPHALTFQEAIYFSGVNFLTIGFGDISPLNQLARITSIIEGTLGVVTLNAFLISLVKKYTG